MPGSEMEGKTWIFERFAVLAALGRIRGVLDLGAGCGTYSNLMRQFAPTARWTAVEVWGPYVEAFKLREKYDEVIISDIRYLDYAKLQRPDCVFAGDVLEHMSEDQARDLVGQLAQWAKAIFISIPIVEYPQEAVNGNPFEEHVEDAYDHARIMKVFPCVYDYFTGERIGVYLVSKDVETCRVLDAWGWQAKQNRAENDPLFAAGGIVAAAPQRVENVL